MKLRKVLRRVARYCRTCCSLQFACYHMHRLSILASSVLLGLVKGKMGLQQPFQMLA